MKQEEQVSVCASGCSGCLCAKAGPGEGGSAHLLALLGLQP